MKRAAASSNVFSYYLRNKLYLSLTNESNSLNSVTLRGPSFQMPASSGFALIPKGLEFVEPTAEQVADAVEVAFEEGKIAVGSMEADEITYAGFGEPLLRLDVLTNSAKLIKDKVDDYFRSNLLFVSVCLIFNCAACLSFLLISGFLLLSVGFLYVYAFCFISCMYASNLLSVSACFPS